MKRTAKVIAVFIAASALAGAARANPAVVKVHSGEIAGTTADGVTSFLGVPYAASPTGDLRWQAPQPPKPWQGIRQANSFGPVCRQTAEWVKLPQSEDCLTLNIWAPASKAAKPLPVLVWIHGGALTAGHGSEWGPDGGKLIAEKGVVFVSINYRLGIFGFFAHPELGAGANNQGFRDQIAALEWVKQNIAAFGGDPQQVTIAGESAGASSVTALTVSPMSKGLFHRAIAESGVAGSVAPRAAAEKLGTDLGLAVKAPHIADLRKISAEDLLEQKWQVMPFLDGSVFIEQPRQSFELGHQNKVPLLIGWNADEGLDLASEIFGTKQITAANYEGLVQKILGPQITPQVLTQYPGKADEQATASAQRLVTDMIGLSHFAWATMQHKAGGPPVYMYYFVHSPAEPPASNPCTYGCKAGHTAEIKFAYGQLPRDKRAWNAEDLALQTQMVGYWTSFVKTGDPNGAGRPRWPIFDGTPDSVLRLGSEAEINARGNFLDFRPYLPMVNQ